MAVYTRRKSKSVQREASSPAIGRRARIVWVSFLASMTVVGGLLMLLDKGQVPRTDGLTLSPLAVASGVGIAGAADPVFETRRPLDTRRWQAIVIHHSGALNGSPASIEREHEARSLKGLGHHFIIGNGRGMEDGQVYLGFRWRDQLPGAHAAGPEGDWYNHHAISICLVGDGDRRPFTPAQLRELSELTQTLCRKLGIPESRVLLHSQIANVSDPGKLFPAATNLASGNR
jgi:hypothetical protein